MIQLTLTPAQNNWLEATWTDVVQAPDVVTPATPDELDDEGYLIAEGTPETTTPGQITRTDVKHVSYHPTQLPLLQADAAEMGTSLDDYAEMLVDWTLNYTPEPPPARTKNDVLLELSQIDAKSIRALREGNQTRLDQLEAQAIELRAELATLP